MILTSIAQPVNDSLENIKENSTTWNYLEISAKFLKRGKKKGSGKLPLPFVVKQVECYCALFLSMNSFALNFTVTGWPLVTMMA